MTVAPTGGARDRPAISRLERFDRVASTQEVVRAWLDGGLPEIGVAVADEQTAGRGRLDRSWEAPPGRALLVSAGFRPLDLRPADAWRVGAIAALAMLEAVEAMQGTATAGLGLKWPNDIVARRGRHVAKLGGVLGEGVVEGDRLVAVVVGIGVNAEWPAHEFPAHLAAAMTSVREVTGGPVDREALLAVWLDRLRRAYAELRIGGFPAVRWAGRQVTTGADVEVDIGTERLAGRALGVDAVSGGLTVRLPDASVRTIGHGEVVRCRLDGMGWDRQRLDWGIA